MSEVAYSVGAIEAPDTFPEEWAERRRIVLELLARKGLWNRRWVIVGSGSAPLPERLPADVLIRIDVEKGGLIERFRICSPQEMIAEYGEAAIHGRPINVIPGDVVNFTLRIFP